MLNTPKIERMQLDGPQLLEAKTSTGETVYINRQDVAAREPSGESFLVPDLERSESAGEPIHYLLTGEQIAEAERLLGLEEHLFTPRHAVTDERLRLHLSPTCDGAPNMRRGKWQAILTDNRGQRWLAWGAPCSLSCHCDAVAIEVRDLDTAPADTVGRINEAFAAESGR